MRGEPAGDALLYLPAPAAPAGGRHPYVVGVDARPAPGGLALTAPIASFGAAKAPVVALQAARFAPA
jgi:hypothetical protein